MNKEIKEKIKEFLNDKEMIYCCDSIIYDVENIKDETKIEFWEDIDNIHKKLKKVADDLYDRKEYKDYINHFVDLIMDLYEVYKSTNKDILNQKNQYKFFFDLFKSIERNNISVKESLLNKTNLNVFKSFQVAFINILVDQKFTEENIKYKYLIYSKNIEKYKDKILLENLASEINFKYSAMSSAAYNTHSYELMFTIIKRRSDNNFKFYEANTELFKKGELIKSLMDNNESESIRKLITYILNLRRIEEDEVLFLSNFHDLILNNLSDVFIKNKKLHILLKEIIESSGYLYRDKIFDLVLNSKLDDLDEKKLISYLFINNYAENLKYFNQKKGLKLINSSFNILKEDKIKSFNIEVDNDIIFESSFNEILKLSTKEVKISKYKESKNFVNIIVLDNENVFNNENIVDFFKNIIKIYIDINYKSNENNVSKFEDDVVNFYNEFRLSNMIKDKNEIRNRLKL